MIERIINTSKSIYRKKMPDHTSSESPAGTDVNNAPSTVDEDSAEERLQEE